MRLSWIIPTVETFGSVREMIEVSNVLIDRGHHVSIFHPQGHKPRWLASKARFGGLSEIGSIPFDVMIGIVDWEPKLYDLVVKSNSKLKAICFMGFNPNDKKFPDILKGKRKPRGSADRIIRDAIEKKYLLLGDGGWQGDWLRDNVGVEMGPAFGGINLDMFHYLSGASVPYPPYRILYSGDGRERKGTDTVKAALTNLERRKDVSFIPESYYGKCVDQGKLVRFLQNGHIFVDGHRRAGWCNPVLEAMACGNAIVCTDIGATRDFAIHQETALKVPVDDVMAMENALYRLMTDDALRERLVVNGVEKSNEFDYREVVPALEQYFLERL